mgnify:CR=1 FL=1
MQLVSMYGKKRTVIDNPNMAKSEETNFKRAAILKDTNKKTTLFTMPFQGCHQT